MALQNNKSLGQHWLRDKAALAHIAECADLNVDDTVLEIGPGLGTLTSELLRNCNKVVAVEYDSELARKLPSQFPGKNLEVVSADILKFDIRRFLQENKIAQPILVGNTEKITV